LPERPGYSQVEREEEVQVEIETRSEGSKGEGGRGDIAKFLLFSEKKAEKLQISRKKKREGRGKIEKKG